jgi:hypothetical protein
MISTIAQLTCKMGASRLAGDLPSIDEEVVAEPLAPASTLRGFAVARPPWRLLLDRHRRPSLNGDDVGRHEAVRRPSRCVCAGTAVLVITVLEPV